MKEERTGTIVDVIFRNEDNGYTVALMETESEYFTVVGNLPRVSKGSRYRLIGSFKEHPTYGEQFSFSQFEEILPTGDRAIFDFLSSGAVSGVGPVTAAALIQAFGEDTLRVIEEEPERLLEVSGIGRKTLEKIVESYGEHRQFAKVSLALQNYGLSTAQALRLYGAYGKDTIALIEDNPYRLVNEVNGFGFRKADIIAEKMGFDAESPMRIRSGIEFTLSYYAGEGSTYVPREELKEKAGELLGVSRELIDDELINLSFTGRVKIENLEGEEVVYKYIYYVGEQRLAADIDRISRGNLKPLTFDVDNSIRQAERDGGVELSEKQKGAVRSSVDYGVSIITGGPGTGKTTIINAIIEVFNRSGLATAICAPTGRAAKRISETSGYFASTVHRLLEYYYSEDTDDMRFGKNSQDPLDYDVVIVDEASMMDLMLTCALTDAIKTGTRLILIGDSDQLPSVGAGNVLRDFIDSEFIHTTRLTEIFRQAEESLIVVNAHRINGGEYPYLNERTRDFFFMERPDEKTIRDTLMELVTTRLGAYYTELDPLRDIQVLTPVRKGYLGTWELNLLLQEALNPPEKTKAEKKMGERIFREGDKVMQIRNNYQIPWKRRSDLSEGQGVFNGDMGTIQTIDNEMQRVTVLFDEERIVVYDYRQLEELEHAYAVTVHKSQGSEFPVVVMPISWFPPMLATRNLLYTAVTRGKKLVVLCGSQKRMEAMVDNNSIKARYSGLRVRLSKLI